MAGGGGAGAAADNQPPWKAAVAFFVFAALNITLNQFNSWALKGHHFPGFDFPVSYTMSHMITSAGAALVLLHFMSVPESSRPSWGQFNLYKSRLCPIALCTTFNIALNNASLTLVSLFVNQVIKACAPLPSIVFSYLVASKRYSWAIVCAVLCICAGSVLADFHNLTTGADSDPLGIILCLISLLANALKPVMAMIVMDGSSKDLPKLPPPVVLFYDSGLSFCFMFCYWVISVERAPSIDYLLNGDQTKIDNPALVGYQTGLLGTGVLFAGCTAAFMFNLSAYYFVSFTSALTSTIGANLVKVILIVAAAIQAGIHDIASWTGVGLVVVSIGAYVWLSYKPSPSAPPAPPADEFNKGGDGAQLTGSAAPFGKVSGPSETTGLLKGSSTV